MQDSRYKAVNTFTKPANANQCIAVAIIIGLFTVFFAAVQGNIQNQVKRIALIIVFSSSFLMLAITTLISCTIDPVDEVIPIYLSADRSSLAK